MRIILDLGEKVSRSSRASRRLRVAQEAANLLYTRQEREYRQAKLCAAENLGSHVLPSNSEIALELDRIAEEREGVMRQEGLVAKRRQAFQIMQILEGFSPILVGSVWRGTARRHSDIDITVYAKDVQQPRSALQKSGYLVTKVEEQRVTKKGREEGAFHIHLRLQSDDEAEIVVRSPEEVDRKVICEIYGDVVTGLTTKQLRRVLGESPAKRFLPR